MTAVALEIETEIPTAICSVCGRPGCKVTEQFLQATRAEPKKSLGFQGYCSSCQVGFKVEPPRRRWNETQEEDVREGFYYATARDERKRTAYLAGPYDTHAEALDVVWAAKRLVEAKYSWRSTASAAYGTARLPRETVAAHLPAPIFTKEEVSR